MKVISVNPPYGTLIAACQRYPELGKHIETRGRWFYKHRGETLIHQTLGLGSMFADEAELAQFCQQEPFRATLATMGIEHASQLPRGVILARVNLIDVVSTDQQPVGYRRGDHVWWLNERERAFGNYAPGRFGLLLADIQALATPIPATGRQGLWDFDMPLQSGARDQ